MMQLSQKMTKTPCPLGRSLIFITRWKGQSSGPSQDAACPRSHPQLGEAAGAQAGKEGTQGSEELYSVQV